ncbi:MAG: hypothetical protein IKL84_08105 [Clostridia bacterium]|nr:hypothetical protein [Clostridia bacterium]
MRKQIRTHRKAQGFWIPFTTFIIKEDGSVVKLSHTADEKIIVIRKWRNDKVFAAKKYEKRRFPAKENRKKAKSTKAGKKNCTES